MLIKADKVFHLSDWGVDDTLVSILLPQAPAHLHTNENINCRFFEICKQFGRNLLLFNSADLVSSIVLSHFLPEQENTLIPLQLLIHCLVEGIADSHLFGGGKKHDKQKKSRISESSDGTVQLFRLELSLHTACKQK